MFRSTKDGREGNGIEKTSTDFVRTKANANVRDVSLSLSLSQSSINVFFITDEKVVYRISRL